MVERDEYIYFMGVCGTGMGSLAGLVKSLGYKVAGSDEHVYPPMSTQLEAQGISLMEGYSPDHLEPKPDLVLIALGVPRQETWSQRVCQGASGVWMGVGGSFDVWAGVKRRAPAWMCRWQIEWLYRLLQEPSRWRRMLSLPAFVWDVLRKGRA